MKKKLRNLIFMALVPIVVFIAEIAISILASANIISHGSQFFDIMNIVMFITFVLGLIWCGVCFLFIFILIGLLQN